MLAAPESGVKVRLATLGWDCRHAQVKDALVNKVSSAGAHLDLQVRQANYEAPDPTQRRLPPPASIEYQNVPDELHLSMMLGKFLVDVHERRSLGQFPIRSGELGRLCHQGSSVGGLRRIGKQPGFHYF